MQHGVSPGIQTGHQHGPVDAPLPLEPCRHGLHLLSNNNLEVEPVPFYGNSYQVPHKGLHVAQSGSVGLGRDSVSKAAKVLLKCKGAASAVM